jgi:hypothetical protein
MSQKKPSKAIDTILDFAIIISVSFIIFYLLTLFGAPLWASLGCVALWGAFTGYKPKWIRKPFKFLYKDEQ